MKFVRSASAGSMDSCDISVRIEAGQEEKNSIFLSSVVERQYGEHIRKLISDVLEEFKVSGVIINAVDRGALDCTIKARLTTALYRACETQEGGF